MRITSHFIGIKVDTVLFRDLFFTLQEYLKKNDLFKAIELQDSHSLHVSLYYLPQKLTPKELSSIKNNLYSLNQDNKDFVLTAKNYGYFKQQNKEQLCYIEPFPIEKLIAWNTFLRATYQEESIPDNQYSYIPHISLYKILNHDVFLKHKVAIEEMLIRFLSKNPNKNLFEGLFLFAVNAKVRPEKQVIVTLV